MDSSALRPLIFALAPCAAMLSGCAVPSQRYPSLLPRSVEQQPAAAPALADSPATAIPADPALDAQIATIEAALAASAQSFTPAEQRATAAAHEAKGSATGSETWLTAQSAMASLDSLRSQSLTALSDLERLAVDRGAAGQPGYPALIAARARAEAQLTAQQAAIDGLQARITGF